MSKPSTYIQERLDSLHAIDLRVAAILDNMGSVFETVQNHQKEAFEAAARVVYADLSKVAIDLRKEVKIMDNNIGVYDKNDDHMMILPISVEQKNTKLGRQKMKEELREMDELLGTEKVQDRR